MTYIIYLHVNKLNGVTYVGITHYTNPNKRWGKSGQLYKHSIKFYNAIQKYGWENFEHIILGKSNKEVAIKLEKALIAYYKSIGKSYNIAEGGEGAESFSEETKIKLSKYTPWIKGKHHTEESRKLISEAGKRPCSKDTKLKIGTANKGNKNGMYGKPISEYTRQRIKETQNKPVIQYTLNGTFIAEYSSVKEAEKAVGGKGGHIGSVCTGKRLSAYGYKWTYK